MQDKWVKIWVYIIKKCTVAGQVFFTRELTTSDHASKTLFLLFPFIWSFIWLQYSFSFLLVYFLWSSLHFVYFSLVLIQNEILQINFFVVVIINCIINICICLCSSSILFAHRLRPRENKLRQKQLHQM